ncbi:MAG TPA: hypothetical protein VGD22_19740 [Sphingobacteriaceae bacterium]
MTLAIIFVGLFLMTIGLYFFRRDWPTRTKRNLIYIHVASLFILLADIALIINLLTSFRTVWSDRVVAIIFFISGALIFALYKKKLKSWAKLYFGIFFFYPLVVPFAFLIDRIFFVIVASPLIGILMSPEVYYSDKNYDIRTMQGLIAPNRLVLVEKSVFSEREIGKSDEETVGDGNYKMLKVIAKNQDSTKVEIDYQGQKIFYTFRR